MSIEILAPAGSMEAVYSAVRSGADAVYLGGSEFSARQNAANFTDEELTEAARYCHLHNVAVHQAINTMLFDSQMEQLKETVKRSAEIGVDAFIIQDLGVLRLVKNVVPDMPVHASTQMTIHTRAGAELAKSLGFSRVVLARELSREQIAEICSVDIEVEAFVHGALCMCVSGQCYLSAMIGSRSANRGLCAQACRLPFSAVEGENRCDLSLKDMSIVRELKELEAMGVVSAKIEGRMKRPEYVAAAVTACRQAVDGGNPDMDTLQAVFSRSGFTDGYYKNQLGSAMFGTREKEDVVSAGDVLPQLKELYRKEKKSSAVKFRIEIKKASPVKLTATDSEGNSVSVEGEAPQIAINRPTDLEQAEKQLSKLGDTIYEWNGVSGTVEDGLMLPASQLNDLRRKAASALDEKRISARKPEYRYGDIGLIYPKLLNIKFASLRVELRRAEQLKGLNAGDIELIILPIEECEKATESIDKIAVAPPRFMPDNEEKIREKLAELKEKGFTHLYCNNPAHIQLGKEQGFTLHGGFGLNVANTLAMYELAEQGVKDVNLSFEMKLAQASHLGDALPYGIIAYGRLPLMLTRNCPVKSAVGCGKCTGFLTDRTGRKLPVVCNKDYAELLNSEVLYMADRQEEIRDVSFITLKFDRETPDEVAEIISCYKERKKPAFQGYTRGLYYRGIQ